MSKIYWVGNSSVWLKPRVPEKPEYAMPLVEEAVLETAFSPVFAGLKRLSQDAAIACISKRVQRERLEPTGLNPMWKAFDWPDKPSVLKTSASWENLGITFNTISEPMHYLNEYAPELLRKGVIEERVEGHHFQVDGFVLDGKIYQFNVLRQIWNKDHSKILKYSSHGVEPEIRSQVDVAIDAIGLDNSPFCVELITSWDHRKDWIIEVNARLGEDTRLPDIICGGEDPLKKIEEICNAD